MRKQTEWGGGPEIVVLANVLHRPIHVYELHDGSEPELIDDETADDASSSESGNKKSLRGSGSEAAAAAAAAAKKAVESKIKAMILT